MRRVLILLCSLTLLVAGMAPAAQADSTVVVKAEADEVTNYFPLTTAWPAGFGCSIGDATPLLPYLRYEDDAPAPPTGLGVRSWGFDFLKSGDFYGVGVDVLDEDDLDTFGMQVYGPGSDDGRAAVLAFPEGTAEGFAWLGIANISGGGDAWTFVNAADLTYAWDEYETSEWTPTSATGMTGTIDEYDAAHGSEFGYAAFMGFGCDGTDYLYDGFKYGPSGNVTTLDFEALTTNITIGATKKTIIAGKPTNITGATDAHYNPSTPVELEVKVFGSEVFTKVQTVQALPGTSWSLQKQVKPMKQAVYRWHYLGAIANDPAYSDEIVINVKTGLTAVLGDGTIKRGNNIVISGKTKPAKPGMTVSLWRKTSTGGSLLATTTVKADGSYKIAHAANRTGTWKVYTTIPASPGNLAGTSVVKTVKVS